MKMMKAVKKLKFWSRKKKKKKAFSIEPPPPPPPPTCHCHHYQYYHPIEPSAPPLPISSSSSSWVDYDHQTHDTIFSDSEFISFASSSQPQVPVFAPQDNPELSPQDPTFAASSRASYQQYMVPNPVYGVPIVPQQVKRERGGGAIGCVFAIGAHLFRCFFPCFHIREFKK